MAELTPNPDYQPGGDYNGTVLDGITGPTISLKNVAPGRRVAVAIHPAGTAKIQVSISSQARIDAGTETWMDWATGNVTESTLKVLAGEVSALRCVSVSGSVTWEIKA